MLALHFFHGFVKGGKLIKSRRTVPLAAVRTFKQALNEASIGSTKCRVAVGTCVDVGIVRVAQGSLVVVGVVVGVVSVLALTF